MTKNSFLLTACIVGITASASASEMKTGDERQTLQEITRPAWIRNDQRLNAEVRTALYKDVSLRKSLADIQFKTEKNVVYVWGVVASEKDKTDIEEMIRSHPGVTEFKSDIQVA